MDKLYQQYRSSLRDTLKSISFIALTADLWLNSHRTYFLCITAHYYDENMKYSSAVISFRRFRGCHLAKHLNAFIMKEIEKLDITSKILSITTDNSSDIKAAVSTHELGTWFSFDAHTINLTVSRGLGLWKPSKSTT